MLFFMLFAFFSPNDMYLTSSFHFSSFGTDIYFKKLKVSLLKLSNIRLRRKAKIGYLTEDI